MILNRLDGRLAVGENDKFSSHVLLILVVFPGPCQCYVDVAELCRVRRGLGVCAQMSSLGYSFFKRHVPGLSTFCHLNKHTTQSHLAQPPWFQQVWLVPGEGCQSPKSYSCDLPLNPSSLREQQGGIMNA